MIDFGILKKFGTTNERLREVLTAGMQGSARDMTPPPNMTAAESAAFTLKQVEYQNDITRRRQLENLARMRIEEGVIFCLRNYQFYAAADLAWDSAPVNKDTLPLILYAQGKVSLQNAAKAIENLPNAKDFVKRDSSGEVISLALPRFFEANINLVRSFITRRVSAQANKYVPLDPFYKYESRSTALVGKLRADVMSQRAEVMVDQYGYRHHDVQCFRDAFLYGHAMDFVADPWDVQEHLVRKDISADQASASEIETESQVMKEGVVWDNIHPSKVFWDKAHPLSGINEDIGPQFVGYWHIVRYRDVRDNPSYFNTAGIGWSSKFWGAAGHLASYGGGYFNAYPTAVTPPEVANALQRDPTAANDLEANVGIYNGELADCSILECVYYQKLIPRDYGIGEYPFPVWVKFVVASDSTFVHAQILPSTPAAYLGINEADKRLINVSMAHELMAYQDQLTNLFSQMLMIVQQELLKVYTLNTDALTDAQLAAMRIQLQGRSWGSGEPVVAEYSFKKMADLGVNVKDVIGLTETKAAQSLTAIFESIAHLLEMAEKLMAMSPAEQGQPAPREISATEVTQIASTTSAVYSFISMGINEFRAAKKRNIYESTVACQKGDLYLPVLERYTPATVTKAGFDLDPDQIEDFTNRLGIHRHTILGTPRALIESYIFTSRDGDERAVSSQAANTLVQMLGTFINSPTFTSALGKSGMYMIINEIFRLSGAGIDLNLKLKPGEDDSLGDNQVEKFQQELKQVMQALQQLSGMTQQNAQDAQQQKQINASVQEHFKALAKLGQEVEGLVHQNAQAAEARESISLNYKDAPPSIKRQMESKAGFQPAPEAEHIALATQ